MVSLLLETNKEGAKSGLLEGHETMQIQSAKKKKKSTEEVQSL